MSSQHKHTTSHQSTCPYLVGLVYVTCVLICKSCEQGECIHWGCDDLLVVVCHWWGHSCVYHTIIGVRELSVCYIIILWSRDAPKGPKTKRNGWTYYTLASLGERMPWNTYPIQRCFFVNTCDMFCVTIKMLIFQCGLF